MERLPQALDRNLDLKNVESSTSCFFSLSQILLCLVAFPLWLLTLNRATLHLLIGFDDKLSNSLSFQLRLIMKSKYQTPENCKLEFSSRDLVLRGAYSSLIQSTYQKVSKREGCGDGLTQILVSLVALPLNTWPLYTCSLNYRKLGDR